MTDNKQIDNTLPLKTAIMGAVVGAAAVILSKKENRDKISKNAKKLFDTGEKKLNDVINKTENAKTTLAKKTEKIVKSLQ